MNHFQLPNDFPSLFLNLNHGTHQPMQNSFKHPSVVQNYISFLLSLCFLYELSVKFTSCDFWPQPKHAKQLCTKDMQMDFLVFSTSVYFRFSTVRFKSGCFVEYWAWIWGENWAPLNFHPMSWLTFCLKWIRSPGCKRLAEGLMAWHAVLVPQGVNSIHSRPADHRVTASGLHLQQDHLDFLNTTVCGTDCSLVKFQFQSTLYH